MTNKTRKKTNTPVIAVGHVFTDADGHDREITHVTRHWVETKFVNPQGKQFIHLDEYMRQQS